MKERARKDKEFEEKGVLRVIANETVKRAETFNLAGCMDKLRTENSSGTVTAVSLDLEEYNVAARNVARNIIG